MPQEIVIKGIPQAIAKLKNSKAVTGPRLKFLGLAGAVVVGNVRERTPVGVSGHARNSVDMDVGVTSVRIFSDLSYIEPLEEGSRPHWPPKGALQPWARRHGFPPGSVGDFLVRRAISQKGTPAWHMFRDGFNESKPKIAALAADAGGAIARIMGGR